MPFSAKRFIGLCVAVSAFAAVTGFSQIASAQNIPLPQSDSKAVNSGAALQITNTGTTAGGHIFAIQGHATGASGIGIYGNASAKKSVGVYGLNSGLGYGGQFMLNGANAQFGQAAVYGVHSGGQAGAGHNGRYGNAGHFEITNKNNFDSALLGVTKSVQGTGVEGDDFSSSDGGGGVAVYGQSIGGISGQFTGGAQGSGTCNYKGGPGWNCPNAPAVHRAAFSTGEQNALLDRLAAMPMFQYAMPGAVTSARYLGPTAADFRSAFHLGDNSNTINTANAQGVALAAAKGLYAKVKQDEQRIAELEKLVIQQKAALSDMASLKASVAALQAQAAATNPVREASLRP
jgi:hypothetical protein